MRILKPTLVATRITLSGMRARWSTALASVLGIALVIAVLLGFLAMAEGFTRSLTAAGSPNVAVIVSEGVRSEQMGVLPPESRQLIEAHLVDAGLRAEAISAELVRVVPITRRDGSTASLVLRGIGPAAFALRPQWRSDDGGAVAMPGEGEIVLGRAAARQLGVAQAGEAVRIGGQSWRVAALAVASGSALESEAWMNANAMRAAFTDQPNIQSLRVPLRDAAMLAALDKTLTGDARLSARIVREDRFYAAQSAGLAKLLRGLAWPLAIAMAIGALAGALNTMFSSVAARAREIATLRAIGFGPAGNFFATFAEALILAGAGAALGTLAVALLLQGRSGSSLAGGGAEISFAFVLTPSAILAAFVFAMIVGVLGGAAPALRAARQPILAGLNGDAQ